MTGVPRSFRPEPNYKRCGNSFERNLVVTGEIPGRNGFGSNRKHTIARIAVVPTTANWWSRQGASERQFTTAIVTRMGSVRNDAAAEQPWIPYSQMQSIEWLLALAQGNLDRVAAIYLYWSGTGEHPETGERLPVDESAPSPVGAGTYGRASEWPLTASDAIYEYVGECAGKSAAWVDDRELVGGTVQHIRNYFCPGATTRAQRARDRKQILELLLDAARAVRCAQYGIWRVSLYRQSVQDWNNRYGDLPGFQQPGAQPPSGSPYQGAGGFQYGTIEPIGPGTGGFGGGIGTGPVAPIPPVPVDWDPPTPDDLPDPGPLGGGGPGGGTDTPGPGATEVGADRLRYAPIAVAVGAVALYYFMKGTR
jgi:hypothetical protein